LNPLTVPLVGLGSSFDLPAEVGWGNEDIESRLQEAEVQDVAVSAAGFQSDGGDATALEPANQLPQPRCVGEKLTDDVATIGCGVDAHPVCDVADVDAGGMSVGHRRVGQPGALLSLLAEVFADRDRFGS
jgi:hypothetical protein